MCNACLRKGLLANDTYLSVGEKDDDVPPQYDILLLYLFCHQVILYEAAVADVGELMAAE